MPARLASRRSPPIRTSSSPAASSAITPALPSIRREGYTLRGPTSEACPERPRRIRTRSSGTRTEPEQVRSVPAGGALPAGGARIRPSHGRRGCRQTWHLIGTGARAATSSLFEAAPVAAFSHLPTATGTFHTLTLLGLFAASK